MKTSEREIKKAIKKYLNTLDGGYFFHYSAYMGVAGIPDIIGVYKGEFVGIEVKMEGKKVTKIQHAVHHSMRNAGAYIGVMHDVPGVKRMIEWIDNNLRGGA